MGWNTKNLLLGILNQTYPGRLKIGFDFFHFIVKYCLHNILFRWIETSNLKQMIKIDYLEFGTYWICVMNVESYVAVFVTLILWYTY